MKAGVALAGALTLAGCYELEEPVRPIASWVVTFEGSGTALDPGGARVVEAAAGVARAVPDGKVTVEPYAASRAGQANQIETRLRAQAVANGLVARGVAKERVAIRPKTAFGADPEVESRRVEIVIGR